jgi:DNA invertase Pin-like site-specific DNA recombinase
MSEKIQATHLERDAYVYVRQSSLSQVRDHLESQDRQYGLAERARNLGFANVRTIDEDLGRSGTGSTERPGFAKLLAAVCAGSVGAVLAMDASRLARNNRDWHHLIDLCAMTHTLVIDFDGTYDPTLLNDRLLLGLKGTMSEFEMSLLRQRALESLRHKARRGEVLTTVAIGYIRTEDARIEMTPDLQIQEAVRGIFAKFREVGTVRQLLLWYHNENILVPTYERHSGTRKIVWRLPVYARLFHILTNPVYAGVFVYGRRVAKTRVVDGRAKKIYTMLRAPEDCEVFIPIHHAGYITLDEFHEIQDRIHENAAMQGRMGKRGSGAAKNGIGLLAGLVRCGKCGRSLATRYGGEGRGPYYVCLGQRGRYMGKRCLSLSGAPMDRVVSAQLLATLAPLGITAALDAWDRRQENDNQKQRAVQLALDKARYEANRIHQQFDAADPANRLVTAELERRWNEALQRVAGLEVRLGMLQDSVKVLTQPDRDRLITLGSDLELVWNHPQCPNHLKKRLLRAVIKEIIVNEDQQDILMVVHWHGGSHTHLAAKKRTQGQHDRKTDTAVTDLIRELARVCDDYAIAAILNRLGYRTGADCTWTASRVDRVREDFAVPKCVRKEDRPWTTMVQAAEELKVSPMVIRKLIANKTLPARQIVKYAPWIIERGDLELPAVQRAVQHVYKGQRRPLIAVDEAQTPLFIDSSEA